MRSKSAVNTIEVFQETPQGGPTKQFPAGFGRSRDSRTWEFYCDITAKDALSTQADAESTGSAVSAINLIRNNSFKSRSQALSPSFSKNNSRAGATSKEGKPKLIRAKSSLARLQSYADGGHVSRRDSKGGHVRAPSGDSDKENWAPGTTSSENPLRRTQPSNKHRPILQENEDMIFRDPGSASQQSGSRGKQSVGKQQSPSKEKAKGEELDCVQGLLSLSQGAWK
jgi:hypothetical protein